jgi:hypothetical protein
MYWTFVVHWSPNLMHLYINQALLQQVRHKILVTRFSTSIKIMSGCQANASSDCNFTCQEGGSWYACDDSLKFVGCCASNPCNGAGCPQKQLYQASLNPQIYSKVRPNECIGASNEHWFTCNDTTPTFIGCCSSNACTPGCPRENLLPAAWSSSNPEQLQIFLDGLSSSSSAVPTSTSTPVSVQGTNTTTSVQGTNAPTSTSTSTSTTQPLSTVLHSGLSKGAIGGIAGGAAAALMIIVILFAILYRSKRRQNSTRNGNGQFDRPEVSAVGSYYNHGPTSPHEAKAKKHSRNSTYKQNER